MEKAKNIMVVDDEPGIRNLLEGVLTDRGLTVSMAQDGLDAWNQMKEQCFDLLVTDIDMPMLDGLELMKRMKESQRKEKILVMTGRCLDQEDLGHEFPEVYCLLRKPFRLGFFIETVMTTLASESAMNDRPLLRANRDV